MLQPLSAGFRRFFHRQAPDIKEVFKRLQTMNQLRLERARSLLGPRQQLFLDFLPLFFHCNHPVLPGFQSLQCPAGLSGYQPSPEMVQRVKRHLANSFQYTPSADKNHDLEALFLMGSIGSVAHAPSSDIDVWVCHRADLSDGDRAALNQKCEDLSHYANKALGLEIHFFLMSAQAFRAGERKALNAEDCGSTQHFLLLDEFYRSAILVAGKYPAWWLISPDTTDYDGALAELHHKHKRIGRLTLDFGNVHQIPAGEYVGAGIWQLFKAISQPHKSLIKLLLIEAYASAHPDNHTLSETLKRQLHQPQWRAEPHDPYTMIYQRLEAYLEQRDEPLRLNLLRRAFYFKTELKLSRRSNYLGWRENVLEELVRQWGWSNEQLHNLDMRDSWRVTRVREEHLELVRELTGSYRFLQNFATRNQADQLISSREMSVLGRKLFSAFERQPDKIDWINSGISEDLAEKNLSFCYLGKADPDKPSWALIAGKVTLVNWHSSTTLRESDSLPALICWCLCNGLIDGDTRFHLASDHPDHHRGKLENLVKQLAGILPDSAYATHPEYHQRFESARYTQSLTCIVGSASQRSSFDTPLVGHVDIVNVTSWGEVICKSFTDSHAAAKAMQYVLAATVSQKQPIALQIKPFSLSAERYASQFNDDLQPVMAFFDKAGDGDRFIFEAGRTYYCFQRHRNTVRLRAASNFSDLTQLLAGSEHANSCIEVSRDNANLQALRCVSELQSPGALRIVFQRREEAADIYVIDGRGGIHYQSLLCDDSSIMLGQLKNFIDSLRKNYFNNCAVAWYELVERNGRPLVEPLAQQLRSDRLRIVVNMLASRTDDDGARFDLKINQKTLHFAQYGKDILKHAADYIREQLPPHQLRFCYVNQILYRDRAQEGVNAGQRLGEALRHKVQIEEALNSALLAELATTTG
ncbi:class I adenylate cyclase [Litorivivens sp.]|uniref:class I adenylate cyclase n=1 Tax=Litorivivens sp. TaxID=2020868 RepID=UPI003563E9EA